MSKKRRKLMILHFLKISTIFQKKVKENSINSHSKFVTDTGCVMSKVTFYSL